MTGIAIEQFCHDIFMIFNNLADCAYLEVTIICSEVGKSFLNSVSCLSHSGDDEQQIASVFFFKNIF